MQLNSYLFSLFFFLLYSMSSDEFKLEGTRSEGRVRPIESSISFEVLTSSFPMLSSDYKASLS